MLALVLSAALIAGTAVALRGGFSGAGWNRVGFDVNSMAIDEATRRHGGRCEFVCGDLLTDTRSFDVVVLSDIVEHIDDDVGFLRAAGSHAKTVLLNLPLENCWATRGRKYGPGDPSGHLRAYGIADARRLLASAGLGIVASEIRWYCESDLSRSVSGSAPLPRRAVRSGLVTVPWVRRRYFPANQFASLSRLW